MPYVKWVKAVDPDHTCKLPAPTGGKGVRRPGLGSVFQCAVCKKQYTYMKDVDKPAPHWQPLPESQYIVPRGPAQDEDFVRAKPAK